MTGFTGIAGRMGTGSGMLRYSLDWSDGGAGSTGKVNVSGISGGFMESGSGLAVFSTI